MSLHRFVPLLAVCGAVVKPLAVIAAVVAAMAWAFTSTSSPAVAQAPTPPPGPPVDIHGEWSITRTYWRSCPRCGSPIIRTEPWEIDQSGAEVDVDRGLKGTVTGSGPAHLHLEGTESDGFGLTRFWYATLHVSPDGNFFEGAFNGSVRVQNPCGSSPPIVTCLVSAGWIQARRIRPVATVPAPPGPPTPGPTATPAPPLLPPGVTATATNLPPTLTPVPASPTPTATDTAMPLAPQPSLGQADRVIFLPRVLSR